MFYGLLADLVLVLHLFFVIFAIAGGRLVLRWRRAWMLHLPALVWGVSIEFLGFDCPLTALENYFRGAAGELGYETGLVDHFISPLIYPGLTPTLHILLGIALAAVNVAIYIILFRNNAFGRRTR